MFNSLKRFFNSSEPVKLPVDPKNRKFLAVYTISLFAFFFLLIVLSFFISERNNKRAFDEYKTKQNASAVSAMQSLESLQTENKDLKQQVSSLQDQLNLAQENYDESEKSLMEDNSALNDQISELNKTFSESLSEADKKIRSAELLWQLQKSYYEKKYSTCRNIIRFMEDSGLPAYLSDTQSNEFTTVSPLAAYNKIKDRLS